MYKGKIGQFASIALVLAVIGLADTTYLTIMHYTDRQVACPDSGIINCENVLSSQYASLIGLPLAVWGLFFFAIEIGIILAVANKDLLVIYSGIGVAFVIYLLYIEYLVGSICIYCTIVHIIVVVTFALSILNLRS
ncbi:MAG: vitamin K epoxide reductase family protein [Candidatus Micrarchaeaceae archaeon]